MNEQLHHFREPDATVGRFQVGEVRLKTSPEKDD
jgi:hypothetical protein